MIKINDNDEKDNVDFKVNNVKVHVCVGENLIVPDELEGKKYSNFFVFRFSHFVYSVFPKKGHVNISGIRNFREINTAVNVFNDQFHTNAHPDNIVVDNSTASGKLPSNFIPIHLPSLLSHQHNVVVSIRPHFFPSAVIRSSSSSSSLSKTRTTILFANGKFNIVGSKSIDEIDRTYRQLCAIMRGL